MATHSSTLAWKIPVMEEPGGLQSMGLQRVGHAYATSLNIVCNKDNGDLLQKVHALPHSVPPTLQGPPPTLASSRDPWALTGKSASVSCGATAPGSWGTRFCCALQQPISQSCVSSGSSMVELMSTSSKRAYAQKIPSSSLMLHFGGSLKLQLD